MARNYIDLGRTFYPAQEGDRTNAIWFSLAGRGEMCWEDLLGYWRVVVLAEGGSGKSAELDHVARKEAGAGRRVFFGRLVRVAEKGMPAGLELGGETFAAWKASGDPAWLFLDSVDEAKGEKVRMDEAFRTIARDIEGAASRLHIVLSGRYTDWEPQGDLALFKRELAWSATVTEELLESPDTLLLEAVSGAARRKPRKPREDTDDTHEALVVGMSPLSAKQVRVYAGKRGVANVEAFVEAVDDANLSTFVRRPIDLDWLVEHWKREGGFARLEVMLEANLRHRLKEPDPHRRRQESFSEEEGLRALERIGAALVLARADEIVIPDPEAERSIGVRALALDEILPDWDHSRHIELLNRPVFDLAREGYVRLHNDNVGEVRAYLAAKWLHRLSKAGNLARVELMRLVFSTKYDVELVKPSMRATAAWLSLWEPAVLERVLEVDPRLLMDAGDAAGLPRLARERAMERWTEDANGARYTDMPEGRALARFAQQDLEPKVRALWRKHAAVPAARAFLLFAIQNGKLKGCADLAESAAIGATTDEWCRSYGTLALLVVGKEDALRRLARYVHEHAKGNASSIVWKVVETLYPRHFTDDQLVDIMRDTHKANSRQIERFEYVAPSLAASLDHPARVERVLKGVLKLARSQRPDRDMPRTHENRDHFVATIEAFGERLLELSDSKEAPALAIEAAIDAKYERRYRPLPSREESDLYARLNETPERRQASLWYAAARFPSNKAGQPIDDVFMLQHRGFAPDLVAADAPWLLEAARTRPLPKDRVLAANSLLRFTVVDGKPGGQWFDALRQIAQTDPIIAEVVRVWNTPRQPTPEDLEHEREMARLKQRNARDRTASDDSWRRFAADVRADPSRLRTPPGASSGAMSNALLNAYLILSSAAHEDNRYGVVSIDPLRPMLGHDAAEAAGQAFMAYWRTWQPAIRAETVAAHAHTLSNGDRVGLTGVTIEAATVPNWARRLSVTEAETAARYALLELNGFPDWIEALAHAHPASVTKIMARALKAELTPKFTRERDILRKLARAPLTVLDLLSPVLLRALRRPGDLPDLALTPVLVALASVPSKGAAILELLPGKFLASGNLAIRAMYLAAIFHVRPAEATMLLKNTLRSLTASEGAALMQAVLPRMFNDGRGFGPTTDVDQIPTEDLEALVHLAYTHVRVGDDMEHLGVYSPTPRDDAQWARSQLLVVFLNRPGPYTFYAIARLQAASDELGLPLSNLASMAYTRAAFDAETSPWPPYHVYRFEQDYLMLPRTSADLQAVALGVFEDLQQRWTTGDNTLDKLVAQFPDERTVQQWVSEQVELHAGKALVIEREPHVHDEKEPDLRLSSKATGAKSPIEIKRSNWTLDELEKAITDQLIGRYLRNPDYRHGILLLVHQKRRSRGWTTKDGRHLNFEDVVARLKALARSISVTSACAAQVEVAVLDVSGQRRILRSAR